MAPPTIPIAERFHAKYRVDESTGCWVWTAALMPNGYAQFRYSKAKNGYGHRFAYEHYKGSIPDGRQIHHACENRACVNPEHLELVTARENVMASDTPARRNVRKTHCVRDHLLAGDNLYVSPEGRRHCRACDKMRRDSEAWKEYSKTYSREYRRNRYANDPEYRERVKRSVTESKARQKARAAKP